MTGTPQRLGDFEIVREIGRGGMGVVYEARQRSLNRKVALKVLCGGLAATSNAVQRFHREAEAAAKLHHSNIVPIYAIGAENGSYFYAMELVEGPSLDEVLRRLMVPHGGRAPETKVDSAGGLGTTRPYDETGDNPGSSAAPTVHFQPGDSYFNAVARLVAGVADALDYAHGQGVIHRDIKPSNLLLSSSSLAAGLDTLEASRVSVADFGLARLLEQAGITVSGEFVGTPAYMSPEQIAAGRLPLDHRTDIYSLGATLYELLTLQRPFTGDHRDKVLAGIIHRDPPAPRKVNRRTPIDLETICLKAMDKDPDQRYPSAKLMAEDLRRYVGRFAITARRAGPLHRLGKWIRRHPGLSAAVTSAAILAILAGLFANRARVAEHQRAFERETAREELLVEKRQAALDRALAAALSGDLKAGDKAIAEAEGDGVAPEQIGLVRGLVAFYRGDNEQATRELEQAIARSPKSVAPRALLAYIENENGRFGKAEQEWHQLAALTPITPEDQLFRAYLATYYVGTNRGLELLDGAIDRHDSVVARAMRGEVRAVRALEDADPKYADLAIEDITIAKGMLPNSPEVLSTSICVFLTAAAISDELGQSHRRQESLRQAGEASHALEQFDLLPTATWGRLSFYDYTGRDDAFAELSSRAAAAGISDRMINYHAMYLYEHGQFSDALDALSRSKSRDISSIEAPRVFALAELPDGHRRALELCREMATRCENTNEICACGNALLLLGCKDESIATCRRLRERAGVSAAGFLARALSYLCNEISDEELVKSAGPSRGHLCQYHALIAMRKLSEGDRKGARQHFQQAIATRHFVTTSYGRSKAFLVRMDRDPTWPPWIAARH
jgi:serine/threonine protein kinase